MRVRRPTSGFWPHSGGFGRLRGVRPPLGSENPDLLSQSVQAIARIAEARHDVADLVEALVDGCDDERAGHVHLREKLAHALDALGGRNEADARDVVGAAVDEELDRTGQRAAGREHRVEYVALAATEVAGEAFGVRERLERLLVADHADEADLGRRHQPGHAVEHAEARAKDGDDQRARPREPYAGHLLYGRLDLCRLDADLVSYTHLRAH